MILHETESDHLLHGNAGNEIWYVVWNVEKIECGRFRGYLCEYDININHDIWVGMKSM